jgi:MFS family permease
MNAGSRARWVALAVVCTGSLMNVLDTTIVGVALPAIRGDLGFSQTSLAWVVNAYLLAFGGFLLLGGRLGDLFGHRRMFAVGIGVFTVASLACGLAGGQGFLLAARAVQGFGGAVASAVALSLVVSLFPEPGLRAKAMGVYGLVSAGGGSIGVLAGGVLTGLLSWHRIFLVNVPIGAGVLAASRWVLPASAAQAHRERLDVAGAVLVTGGVVLAIYAIVTAGQAGWASARTGGLLAAAEVVLAAFAAAESRRPRRWCRCGCCASATWPQPASSACCGRQPCSPAFSSPPCTCSSTPTWSPSPAATTPPSGPGKPAPPSPPWPRPAGSGPLAPPRHPIGRYRQQACRRTCSYRPSQPMNARQVSPYPGLNKPYQEGSYP